MKGLIDKLLGSGAQKQAMVPPGRRVYAVGDIHGRDDLLGDLLDEIAVDNVGRDDAETTIVFLGDLIDRGPSSAQVVERLRQFRPGGCRPVFLMGNHEEVLLRIIAGDDALVQDWLCFGGAECMQSYGTDPHALSRMGVARAGDTVRAKIPPEHVQFLSGFADTFRAGDYLFVHAGVRPGVPFDEQTQHDLRWIRRPFLDDERDTGTIVVHGHTISDKVEVRRNRIGIDTGAYYTGALTAIGIQNADQWFLQATGKTVITATSPF